MVSEDEQRIHDWLVSKGKEYKDKARWSRDPFTRGSYQDSARSVLVVAAQIKNGEHKK